MAQVTITISDDLVATYQRFQTENGSNWAGAYVDEKCRELKARHDAADKDAMLAQFQALSDADKAVVTSKLAVGQATLDAAAAQAEAEA